MFMGKVKRVLRASANPYPFTAPADHPCAKLTSVGHISAEWCPCDECLEPVDRSSLWEARDHEVLAWRGWCLLPVRKSLSERPSSRHRTVRGIMPAFDGSAKHVRLWSMTRRVCWGGPTLTADRRPEVPNRHGVYALKHSGGLTGYAPIYGQVGLSGQIVEYEGGYRAERCVIRTLHLDSADLSHWKVTRRDVRNWLEELYQCPVIDQRADRSGPRSPWLDRWFETCKIVFSCGIRLAYIQPDQYVVRPRSPRAKGTAKNAE